MKFLKNNALESLVFGGRDVSATICKRSNEKLGFPSSSFRAASA
jgi:hypothetical protein